MKNIGSVISFDRFLHSICRLVIQILILILFIFIHTPTILLIHSFLPKQIRTFHHFPGLSVLPPNHQSIPFFQSFLQQFRHTGKVFFPTEVAAAIGKQYHIMFHVMAFAVNQTKDRRIGTLQCKTQ